MFLKMFLKMYFKNDLKKFLKYLRGSHTLLGIWSGPFCSSAVRVRAFLRRKHTRPAHDGPGGIEGWTFLQSNRHFRNLFDYILEATLEIGNKFYLRSMSALKLSEVSSSVRSFFRAAFKSSISRVFKRKTSKKNFQKISTKSAKY